MIKTLGAIIGDVVGSVYEFHNIKTKNFSLFNKDCHFTDDTILTCAVAEWLMSEKEPAFFLRKWGILYKDRTYENGKVSSFGKGFLSWLETGVPTDSRANGCIMRLSPVGRLSSLNEALKKAEIVTKTTHNHPESLNATQAYIETMFLVKQCKNVKIIKNYIQTKYGYDLSRCVDDIRPSYNKFYCFCKNCVPQSIICALDAVSYEDALRNAVSLGGDSDTLACMAGGIAEVRFGVPKKLIKQVSPYLDRRIKKVIERFYKKQNVRI